MNTLRHRMGWLSLWSYLCTSVAGFAAEPPLRPGLPRLSGPRGDSALLLPTSKPGFERVLPKFELPTTTTFPDTLDIIHLTNVRPVRVRVTLLVNGTPLRDVWREHLRKLFNTFDRDHDGYLNRFETDNIFSPKAIIGQLSGSYSNGTGDGGKTFEELDRDGDNRVSFPEFAVSYDEAVSELVRFQQRTATETDQSLTLELFKRLDTNQDGKLSKAELDQAENLMLAWDTDENGTLSAEEIRRQTVSTPRRATAIPAAAPTTPAVKSQLLFVFRGDIPGAAAEDVRKKYSGKHTISHEPDFFAVVNIAQDQAKRSVSVEPSGGKLPSDCELRPGERGRHVLKIGNQLLDLSTGTVPPESAKMRFEQHVNEMFPPDRKELRESNLDSPNMQYLRIVFDAADFNADGKLTRSEFRDYLQVQQDTIDLALAARFATRKPNLFQLLDANGDGQLSLRELRTAWKQLIVLEPNGGEFVTAAALQPSNSVRFGYAAYQNEDYSQPLNPFVVRSPKKIGPLWFQKMDRNSDGDVSHSEFIGPREKFDEIDADKDRLISAEEADAFDKKTRKK